MRLLRRLWFLLRKRQAQADLAEEMTFHREMAEQELRSLGLTSEDAAFAARRSFGSASFANDAATDVWISRWLQDMVRDARHALRAFRKNPGFVFVAVTTLAIGIAAVTSVLAFVDVMLLRPPAWPDSDRFVWIASLDTRSGRVGSVSYPDYVAYRDRATTLRAVVASGGTSVSVGGPRPQRVLGGLVSGNFFDALGTQPAMGRLLTAQDDTPTATRVVVLSYELWRDQFGADPSVVNRSISINHAPFTVVGIAPQGFSGPAQAADAEQLWMSLAQQEIAMPTNPGLLQAKDIRWLRVVGRVRETASLEQARTELRLLAGQVAPANTNNRSVQVLPMRGGMTPWEQHDFAPVLWLLPIVPALVLLVACANVANIVMARNFSRRREFAMRCAIGASLGRLIRLLLMETLLLALLAALIGYAFSHVLTTLVVHVGDIPTSVATLIRPESRALLTAIAVAILTTVVFGLLPAVTATQFDLVPTLKADSVTLMGIKVGTRWRGAFVVAQVAVSLALIIVAGLFLQSLAKAMDVNPGFDPKGMVTVSFDPDLQGYTATRREALVTDVLREVSDLPGTISAAVASNLPLSGRNSGAMVVREASPDGIGASFASVSPRYFETLRVPILLGRDFSTDDTGDSTPVAIVSHTLARQLWPDSDPIGKRLRGADSTTWHEVIGVVGDVKYQRLTESARGALYYPLRQQALSPLTLVVRTTNRPADALAAIDRASAQIDQDLPLFQQRTVEEAVARSLSLQRASASMLGVCGALTLFLAAIGVYGVAAQNVSQRTREIGVRVSLGARPLDVSLMFMRETFSLAGIGVVLGVAVSAGASTVLTTLLFGLTGSDVNTFVGGSVIVGIVAAISTYIPVKRALRVDPAVALRTE